MTKTLPTLTGLLLYAFLAAAQPSNELTDILQQVRANNKTLKAFRKEIEGDIHQYRSGNRPPDPQVSMYYMPFGEHRTADYSEYEISQSFAFPTVYSLRSQWIDLEEGKMEQEYAKLEQRILLRVKKLYYGIVHVRKRQNLAVERAEQAEKMFGNVQKRHEKGEAGVLSLNKAELVRIDDSFRTETLKNREERLRSKLQALNGGKAIEPSSSEYPDTLGLPPVDTVWTERKQKDPVILAQKQAEKAARKQRQLEKHKLLPDLTAGYNVQGVPGSNYSGVYGGISIPLWGGKQRAQMAEARVKFREEERQSLYTKERNELEQKYLRYQMLLKKYRAYKETLKESNSLELLRKSYELGEIPFKEYYREVEFYRNAQDRMLEMERTLYELKAEILRHRG